MIHIFTIMTSVYTDYFNGQYRTMRYLFPNHKKTYTLISDIKPTNFDYLYGENLETRFVKIMDLPYPLVPLCKTMYMVNNLPENASDDDIFIFVDADTKFLKMSDEFYDSLYEKMKSHDFVFALNPWCNQFNDLFGADSEKSWWYATGNKSCIEFMNDDAAYASHFELNESSVWCQTSFFAGKIGKLKEIDKDIRQLMTQDLNHEDFIHKTKSKFIVRHLPIAFEESYINKIINECLNPSTDTALYNYDILIDDYIINYNLSFRSFTINFFQEKYPNIFLLQKYNMSKKMKKRNNKNFND